MTEKKHKYDTNIKVSRNDFKNFQWLLEKKDSTKKKENNSYIPYYGDVTQLNTERTILDLVGKDTLEMLCTDIMDLLDTSVAIYEKNGDYAFGMFVSGWCQLMDAVSRKLCNTDDNQEALTCGKWLCHENCWNESAKVAIETGKPTDIDCIGGINLYAEPINVDNQTIGVINIGYGNPPTDKKTLKELSRKFQVEYNILSIRAREYKPRPPFIIDIAKKRLHTIAFLIGKIAENAQNERKIKEREEDLEITKYGIDHSKIGVYRIEEDGTITYVNYYAAESLGYLRSKLIGRSILEIDRSLNAEEFKKHRQGVRKKGSKTFITTHQRKDGTEFPVEVTVNYLTYRDKSVSFSFAKDITERKKAEENLKNTKDLLEKTEKVSKTGGWEYDVRNKRISWTDEVYHIYGVDKNKYNPNSLQQNVSFFTPQDQLKIEHAFQKALQEGKPYDLELSFISGKGERRWVRTIGRAIIENGKIVKVNGNITDITQRKESEERIKHLKRVLLAIRDVNQLIIKEKNHNELIRRACKILTGTRGYYGVWIVLLDKNKKFLTFSEAGYGSKINPIIDKLKKGQLPKQIQKVLRGNKMIVIEDPRKVGEDCPLSDYYENRSAYSTVLCQNKTIYGIVTVCIPKEYAHDKEEQSLFKEVVGDLSFALYRMEIEEKHKQAVKLLGESEERYRTLFDSMAEGCQVIGYDWRYLYINDAAAEHGKKSKDKLIGKTMMEVYPGIEETKMFSELKNCLKNRKIQSMDNQFKYPDGTSKWFQLIMQPIPEGAFILSLDMTDLKNSQQKLKKTLDATIEVMSKVVETRDPYTAGHQERVSQLSMQIAYELRLSQEEIEGIRIASLIHDIGKIGIPSEILNKPTKLTKIEFGLIRSHPQTGYDIVSNISFPYPLAEIILQHHEKLDGSGYPNHLKGPEIKLEAKILCVADVVEAISSHRPYRPALGIDVALDEISKNKGVLYDPEIVDVCVKLFIEKGFNFK